MKRILLLVIFPAMMLLLTACFEGVVNSDLTITNTDGAGTRTLSVKIYKDGVPKPDYSGELVSGMVGEDGHLPNGTEAVKNKLIEVCNLDDAEIELVTDDSLDYDLITITYSFDDIADYNNKTRILADGAPIVDAELTLMDNELVFMEPTGNFKNTIQWAVDAVYDDPDVFQQLGVAKSDITRISDLKVTVLSDTRLIQKPSGNSGQYMTAIGLLGPIENPELPPAQSTGYDNLMPPFQGAGMPLKAEPDYEWTELFNRTSGWLGADGIYSIPLNGMDSIGSATGDTKTFWTFSDTNLGTIDPATREFSFQRMSYNSIGVLTGNEPVDSNMRYIHGYRGDMTYIPPSLYGYKIWPVDGIVVDNMIYMLGHRTDEHLVPLGIDEIRIPIINGEPDVANLEITADVPLMFQDNNWEILFGTAILDHTAIGGAPVPDGYVYIYGFRNNRITGEKGVVVARVLREHYSDLSEWTFFDGTAWQSDMMAVHSEDAVLASNLSVELSVTPINSGVYNGKYMLVYTRDVITPYLEYRIGDSPVGPFGAPVHFYTASEPGIYAADTFAYNAKAHPHLSKPGELLVSYNVNSWGFPGTSEIYRPRFITLKLDEFAATAPHSPATTNVALGKPATASHFNQQAGKAVNGSWSDRNDDMWAGPSLGDKWLTVDLGDNYSLSRWVVRHASAGGEATAYNTKDFRLQRSQDGTTWHDVDAVSYNAAPVTDRTVASFQARYVRLYITEPSQGTDPVARIYEFEVYGEEAPAMPIAPKQLKADSAYDSNGKLNSVKLNWELRQNTESVPEFMIYVGYNAGNMVRAADVPGKLDYTLTREEIDAALASLDKPKGKPNLLIRLANQAGHSNIAAVNL